MAAHLFHAVARLVRRTIYCRFGSHWKVVHRDDRGIAGAWSCGDCGFEHAAIVWPLPAGIREPCKSGSDVVVESTTTIASHGAKFGL